LTSDSSTLSNKTHIKPIDVYQTFECWILQISGEAGHERNRLSLPKLAAQLKIAISSVKRFNKVSNDSNSNSKASFV
jgi:hypothetical protein